MSYLKKLYGSTTIDEADSSEIRGNRKIKLEYYHIKEDTLEKPYGVEIIKRNMEKDSMNIEEKTIYSICDKEQDNYRLLNILMTNKVTPITVNEVIEDLLKRKLIRIIYGQT